MNQMNLQEAQLFRMLVSFFGEDQVIWSMSVRTVCGGEIPKMHSDPEVNLQEWAGKNKCLFTVVDAQDSPRVVFELAPDFSEVIDLERLAHMRILPGILHAAGVRLVSIKPAELGELLDPESNIDFVAFLQDQFLGDEGIPDRTSE